VDDQEIVGNAVFAAMPLQGGMQSGNFSADYSIARRIPKNPDPRFDEPDFAPRPDELIGEVIDLKQFAGLPDHDRDFAGALRSGRVRGAFEHAITVERNDSPDTRTRLRVKGAGADA
jgi:hypothetical protein